MKSYAFIHDPIVKKDNIKTKDHEASETGILDIFRISTFFCMMIKNLQKNDLIKNVFCNT